MFTARRGGWSVARCDRGRTRSCDIVTVESGHITRHNFYYDQMEFLGQLGLLSGAG